MKKYSVMVRGEGFFVNLDEQPQVLNFLTTRKVKAHSMERAEQKAIRLVKEDPELLAIMIEDVSTQPTLFIEEVAYLRWWARLGGKGYTFYSE